MELSEILSHFDLPQQAGEIRPLGNGLINDTYFVEPGYVLQRINHQIFTDVDALQDNIAKVTRHLRRKLQAEGVKDIDRAVLCFYPLKGSDKTYFFDGKNYWRVMRFIDHSVTHQEVNPRTARMAGREFGRFQALLADMAEPLTETIPRFHDIWLRTYQLSQAKNADPVGRVKKVRDLLRQIEAVAPKMGRAEQLNRDNLLRKRVCHCDTKVNNMLFDEQTDEPLCVIDLDTVMPAYVLSDYGDFLRTAANTVAEDDPDVEAVEFRHDIFEAFTEGYLQSTSSFLTILEKNLLAFSASLFPYMQAVRFLTDYINGDTYYKTQYPEHNLVRARNQWRLFEKAQEATPYMEAFIDRQWRK